MGKASRVKGSGFELEIVKAHKRLGINAFKMPLSGALKGKYKGDIQVYGLIAECKRRKKGFTSLYKAIAQDNAELVFVRDDNRAPLVVLPWETYLLFLTWAKVAEVHPLENEKDNNN